MKTPQGPQLPWGAHSFYELCDQLCLIKLSETGVAEGERKAGVKEVLREGQVNEQEEGWSQGLLRLPLLLGHRHGR